MFKKSRSLLAVFLAALIILTSFGCNTQSNNTSDITAFEIDGPETLTMYVGDTFRLQTNAPPSLLAWTSSDVSASVSSDGVITAHEAGEVIITAVYGKLVDRVTVIILPANADLPAIDQAARDAFYGDSDPADSYEEAIERSKNGELSGATTVPDQAPTLSTVRPDQNGVFIRNNQPYFADENTYVVVNYRGQEVFRVYRGGGYITLEEVAAYLYAFGEIPANYTTNKKGSPQSSIWGENLRCNYSKFSGSTTKYPYEPKLPRISGCGGDLYYYEIDIGTTGTDCDPSYPICTYNDGVRIERGAARIVFTVSDKNGNKIIEPNEKYLFYTYNHYNDFQEYLNYFGGWGEMFGNITGGGKLSSKTNYNPTPYVPSVLAPLLSAPRTAEASTYLYLDFSSLLGAHFVLSRSINVNL